MTTTEVRQDELTREEFRELYPKMSIDDALKNIKNLIDFNVANGGFKKIEQAVLLNKSLEMIEDFINESKNKNIESNQPIAE